MIQDTILRAYNRRSLKNYKKIGLITKMQNEYFNNIEELKIHKTIYSRSSQTSLMKNRRYGMYESTREYKK